MGIFVLIFSLCRVLFLLVNNDLFPVVYFTDFLAGIWFDLVTTAIVFLPLVALEIFPNKFRGQRWCQIILAIAFNITLALSVFINLVDIEYFRHTASRSTSSLFTMLGYGNDLTQQIPSFIADYWYLILIAILLQLLGIWLYRRVNRIKDDSDAVSWIKQLIILPVMITFLVLIGRGGIGLKPIAAINASAYTIDQNVQLILNSAFTVIKTWGDVALEEKSYYSEDELDQIFTPIRHYSDPATLTSPNVVILLMESFSVEYISAINGEKEVYTPFLDSLIDESLVFTNCYANGKKSMDAVPAVISSIPKLMEIEYLTSQYSANQIESLPKILKELGYSSSFFHGATNGSMNFDTYSVTAGFEKYFGRTEYNNDEHFDGTWGIYDEEFFLWSIDQISKEKSPFFSTIFSISSHPPYTIPKKHRDRFKGGPTEMHDAIAYSDYALAQFFKKAKKTDWYENTLFIILADHTPASSNPIYFKDMGNMHIPLVFFHPTDSTFKGRNEKVVGQEDIMPSILHLLGYQKEFFAFGHSVFSDESGYSASCVGNKFLYFGNVGDKGYLLTYQNDEVLAIYDLNDQLQSLNIGGPSEYREKLESRLKAMIQAYNHALINNAMTVERQ